MVCHGISARLNTDQMSLIAVTRIVELEISNKALTVSPTGIVGDIQELDIFSCPALSKKVRRPIRF